MSKKRIFITGGAGFIGSNSAEYFASKDWKVTVFDNFSRNGSVENAKFLKNLKRNIKIVKGDIRRDRRLLDKEIARTDAVLHLAAQVAVTTSITNPREDFETNVLGTFNVLESIRNSKNRPPIIYSSTNKVYGAMEELRVKRVKKRYIYVDYPFGISEKFPLDFHSPYGCSKGAADQYVRDYARIYGLKTVVFRQSCIYGPRQFGVEDQGWLAWFIIAVVTKTPITIYGDGRQVRDVLFIDDLVRAYELAFSNKEALKGEIFNVGGGLTFAISVWSEFGSILEDYFGKKINVNFAEWRLGDQKIYISDIRKIKKLLGWKPQISPKDGISMFCKWVENNKELFK
ncbi:CDP-paratose 2-epimerase [Candidatus Woesebacteria bacterium RIFCSPLOWO2_01_FULL_39_21]|uniref:CDP-paratose 2-epimerase n=1 Tax=Candidatus Woesebacteria bacterium RIFCSPLOWO2_01_FULL_39_21 TaxID=1802519 RepID=A0A1F8BHP2_9BACT|nr:MAG: CDP-paratose 2-epimerase [Candidatus Woesebacteria bacterium RIFCSPHIGHO2_01_FULL_39_23]OGM63553.1 MAG: CDP-paratose 2-epimerase [Candidatus Woesebacteria bacterium RIFCSPLOWO2_01_FULL_39_21]